MQLEICASNIESAINAQEAGAHRIELCQELAVGGITPSYGLIKHALDTVTIPVFVLIRPRSGNFTYTDPEFEIMKQNIRLCKDLGAKGIVSGVLNIDNTIDLKRTKILVELSKPLPFTFHRAFDWIPNPIETIQQLINIGVNRILTSGQGNSAEKGIRLLNHLKEKANDKITIIPGGGINSSNTILFKSNGFKEIHASASKIITISQIPKVSMVSTNFLSDSNIFYSDKESIKSILRSLNA